MFNEKSYNTQNHVHIEFYYTTLPGLTTLLPGSQVSKHLSKVKRHFCPVGQEGSGGQVGQAGGSMVHGSPQCSKKEGIR